jgi:hypothetical protein
MPKVATGWLVHQIEWPVGTSAWPSEVRLWWSTSAVARSRSFRPTLSSGFPPHRATEAVVMAAGLTRAVMALPTMGSR